MTLSIAIFDKGGHAQACATRAAFDEQAALLPNVMPRSFAYPEEDLAIGALPAGAGPYTAAIVPNTWHVLANRTSLHGDGSIRRFQMQDGGAGEAKTERGLPKCPACLRIHLPSLAIRAWWRRWRS